MSTSCLLELDQFPVYIDQLDCLERKVSVNASKYLFK